jgi:asparagine synthase (glutamine-hydrolysing)
MSGIAGIVRVDGAPADAGVLGRMASALTHRGPDGEGRWMAGPVGMMHRRLATGCPEDRQPIVDVAEGRALVVDGRLDAPVPLLAAARRWGPDFPAHVRGDFALVLWDAAARRVVCARDAFGVKPLYYHWDGRRLLFASEIAGLFADESVARRPDVSTLADYLLMDMRDPGATFFDGVRRLPAGHVLVLDEQRLTVRRYWTPDGTVYRGRDDAHAEEFAVRLRQAVRDRVAGAPAAGLMLSGGIDSTLIAATAGLVRGCDAGPLASVTFVHEEFLAEDWDAIGALVAAGFVKPPRIGPGDYMPDTQLLSSEPPNAEGYLSPAVVLAEGSQDFRVLLTGIGGDELSTAAERGAIGDLLRTGRVAAAWREASAMARAYHGRAGSAAADVLWTALPLGLRTAVRRVRRRRRPRWLRAHVARERRPPAGEHVDRPFETQLAAVTWRALTAPSFTMALEKLDAEAARVGVEPRHPYLDRRVVECFLATPPAMLIRHGYRKQFVQRALGCPLPLRAAENPREHVPSATDAELRRRDAVMLAQGLFRPDARVFDYVDRAEAERMRTEYLARGAPYGSQLWRFLLLETWLRRTFAS